MLFRELAAYFERLEATSSRNTMVQILAEMLRQPTAEEIDKVVYLCQGRLVPFFEPLEIGVGERLAEDAIALAYTRPARKCAAPSTGWATWAWPPPSWPRCAGPLRGTAPTC